MKFETKMQVRLTLIAAFANFCIMLISVGLCLAWLYVFRIAKFSNAQEMLVILSVFAVRSVLVGTLATLLLGRILLKPLQEVICATDRISNGDYSVRLHPHGLRAFREMESRFNHMAEELGGVEILRSDFINNFSHEFKTPIASICGYAEMVKNGGLSAEEQTEYLETIILEARRLSDLSTNILNLSALEKQSILTDRANINISEQLRLSVALLFEKAQEKDLSIRFDADELFVTGNRDLLKQVWINLLDNAIKFSYPHTEIQIELQKKENAVFVMVTNYGKTIPPEEQERIFSRFYQCDKSHTTPGNGLGLSIAQRIITLHGGKISVCSEKEKGTAFCVSLPDNMGERTLKYTNAV